MVSVNTLQRGLIRDEFERLRMLIYDAVCHLQLEYDGISRELCLQASVLDSSIYT